jgi:hypothetical protein
MPDTMLQSPAPAPSCGTFSDYRSPLIGQLVAARAKATKEIKRVVKDKTADIPTKSGGRGFQYAYADLAGVMEAVEDALAAQEMALFQTTQERNGKVVLVTTLAHSSDQWISSEVRIASPDAGPQIFGSSLTYMRRYCALGILGIAPEQDDDGRAAQTVADQQRSGQLRRSPTQKLTQATQRAADDSDLPQHIGIPADAGGLRIRDWLDLAKAALDGRPEAWRRSWLELHQAELEELRSLRPNWADRVEAAAIAPDLAGPAA